MERFPLPPPERTIPVTPSRKNIYPSRNESERWTIPVSSFQSTYSSGDETRSAFSYFPQSVTEDYPHNKVFKVSFVSASAEPLNLHRAA